MPKLIYRVVSACGALGYGYPRESLEAALRGQVDAIICDGGSMDAGPYYLGTGTEYFEREAVKLDFRHMVEAGARIGCPVILGSCGMAGGDRNLDWMIAIAKEVFAELGIQGAKVAVIRSELDPEIVIKEFRAGSAARDRRRPRSRRGGAARKHHRRPDGNPSPDHRAGERRAIHPCRTELRHRAVRVRHDPPQYRCGAGLSCRPRPGMRRAGLRSRFAVRLSRCRDL